MSLDTSKERYAPLERDELTFSEAIEQVMLRHGYYASLQLIYEEFELYRPFTGRTPLKTIQERVQRDKRFTRIGRGVYALTEYLGRLAPGSCCDY
jgi:hypothetical protein